MPSPSPHGRGYAFLERFHAITSDSGPHTKNFMTSKKKAHQEVGFFEYYSAT